MNTLLKLVFLTFSIISFQGCFDSNGSNSYPATFQDLLNKNFVSLDDTLPNINPAVYTTNFEFDSDFTYMVYEDQYIIDKGSYKFSYKQPYKSEIMRIINADNFQVLDILIQRLNLDGEPVISTYKFYRLTKMDDIIILIQVEREQHWSNSGNQVYKWVDIRDGDTTYLMEY